MRLRAKFIAVFFGVGSLVSVLGAMNLLAETGIYRKFEIICRDRAPTLVVLGQIKAAALALSGKVYSYGLLSSELQPDASNNNVKAIQHIGQEFLEERENIEASLAELKTLAYASKRERLVIEIEEKLGKIAIIGREAIALKSRGAKEREMLGQLRALEEVKGNLVAVLDEAIALELKSIEIENHEIQRSLARYIATNLVSVTGVVLLASSLGYILAQQIAKPIIELQKAAARIGEREWDRKVKIETGDEIEDLARAFNKMVDQLKSTTISKSYSDKIIRSLNDALIVLAPDATIQDFNLATSLMLDYQEEELLGQSIKVLIKHQNVLDYLNLDDSQESSFLGTKETALLTKNGREIPVSFSASVMRDGRGKVHGLVCLAQDISDRKQAMEALRKQALMFKTIYDGIIVTDLEGHIIDWNPASERIFGYAKKEVLGKTPEMLYRPDRAAYITSQIIEGVRRNGQWVGEIRFLRKDGTKGVCETVTVMLRDEKGFPSGTIGVNRDITDRKLAEEALYAAHAELEKRVDERTAELLGTNDILIEEIRDRVAAEKALRRSETQFRRLAQEEVLLNQLANQIRNSLDLNTILETAVHQIRSLLHIDRCLFIWYREQGERHIQEVVSEAKGITLTSLLGRYIVSRKNLLAPLLLGQDIIRIDDLNYASISPQEISPQEISEKETMRELHRRWGYTAILALPIRTGEAEIGVVSCGHCSGARPWSDEEVGMIRAIADQVAIAISQASLYAQAQIAAREAQERAEQLKQTLSQLQHTQAQLLHSEKMSSIGQLVAGVAHEINNPVSFIYGNLPHAKVYMEDLLTLVQLYRECYPEPESEIQAEIEACELDFLIKDLPKVLSSIEMGADRIRSIVLALRNFSRLQEADRKPADLHEGLDNTLLILKHRLNSSSDSDSQQSDAGVAIKTIKEYGALPKVECYPGQLNQVFMNIIGNAIDVLSGNEELVMGNGELVMGNRASGNRASGAQSKSQKSKVKSQNSKLKTQKSKVKSQKSKLSPMPNSPFPTIRISTEMVGDGMVAIRIADNGPGIDEEVRKQIFDPFFTTKAVGSGTGLGLSISYQIVVEKHCGSLRCVSAPGQGAEFIIELPVRLPSRQLGQTGKRAIAS
ncbi:MAG: PAS domain S-box protein [Oscillatoria sp. SIO1A7]|nr:PAS domain S-box protein [Oscillatoria sp. SIO1A7]